MESDSNSFEKQCFLNQRWKEEHGIEKNIRISNTIPLKLVVDTDTISPSDNKALWEARIKHTRGTPAIPNSIHKGSLNQIKLERHLKEQLNNYMVLKNWGINESPPFS
tara:strand:+ start:131 stop:454 length:324 start_codon:yes stop_codon:yes gene_type:complete